MAQENLINIVFARGERSVYNRDTCCAYFDLIGNMLADTGDNGTVEIGSVTMKAFSNVYNACETLVRELTLPNANLGAYRRSCKFLLCPLFDVADRARKIMDQKCNVRASPDLSAILHAIAECAPKFADRCIIPSRYVVERHALDAMVIANNYELLAKMPVASIFKEEKILMSKAYTYSSVECLDYLLTISASRPSATIIGCEVSPEAIRCLHSHGIRDPEMLISAIHGNHLDLITWLVDNGVRPTPDTLVMAIRRNRRAIIEYLMPQVPFSRIVVNAALVLSDIALIRRILGERGDLRGFEWRQPMSLEPEFLTFVRELGMRMDLAGGFAVTLDRPDSLIASGTYPDTAEIAIGSAAKCAQVLIDRGLVLDEPFFAARRKPATPVMRVFIRASNPMILPSALYAHCSVGQLHELLGAGKLTNTVVEKAVQHAAEHGEHDALMFFIEHCRCEWDTMIRLDVVATKAMIDLGRFRNSSWHSIPYECSRYAAEKGELWMD